MPLSDYPILGVQIARAICTIYYTSLKTGNKRKHRLMLLIIYS